MFDATDGLSRTITAQAIATNQTFPFVTIDNFEVYARDARIACQAESFAYTARVKAQDIMAFNEYSITHSNWVKKSQALTNALENENKVYDELTILPFIYDTTYDINTGEQTIVPTRTNAEVLWQTSPVIDNGFLLMSNLVSLNVENSTNIYGMVDHTNGKGYFSWLPLLPEGTL